MKIIVGITGASGSVYAISLLRGLLQADVEIFGVCSQTGKAVMQTECGVGQSDFPFVSWHEPDDMFASLASGSNCADGMVIVPCSMNTLSCVAHGISNNLLQRAAAVMLKESRKLILVPRETPLSVIQLDSMLKLANAGAIILPAAPGFYKQPQSIQDLVNFITERIITQLINPITK
ncbi:MAG: UbiX family flavin prenyltransferase [Planctomycetaceae bacterium]|jgi:4-hydroxy-3-polyprenylbenzoate decarboxylase|nr:UbiX family flavin prenyltransferase [Planctomycetaceae bacterium]